MSKVLVAYFSASGVTARELSEKYTRTSGLSFWSLVQRYSLMMLSIYPAQFFIISTFRREMWNSMAETSREIFESIVASLREAGYAPYSQIAGYLQTGDLTYITRSGDVGHLISQMDGHCFRSSQEG